MSAPDEHTLVDADGLADWSGETKEHIAAFVAEGVLKPDASGRYPLLASCLAIIKYWRGVIARQDEQADGELAAIEPHGSA
jgi:hypothetical protein